MNFECFLDDEEIIKKIEEILNSSLSVIIADIDGKIIYASIGLLNKTGYILSELQNRNFSSIMFSEENFSVIRERILENRIWKGEYLSKTKSGESYTKSSVVYPLSSEKKKYFIEISEDLSGQKRIVDLLTDSFQFIENVMNRIEPMLVINEDYKVVMSNRPLLDFLGYGRKEIISRKFSMFFPEDGYRWIDRESRLLVTGRRESIKIESEIQKKDGSLCDVTLNMSPLIRDGKDNVVIIIKDITQKKIREEQIRKLTQAVEQSPAVVIITDTSGYIEYVNPKFEQITGYSFDEVRGKKTSVLKSGQHSSEFYKDLWDTINKGNEWKGEFRNKKKNGEIYWESASISPIRNRAGQITHFLAVKENITERKRAEEALKMSEEALRKKNSSMMRELQYAGLIIKQILPDRVPRSEFLKIEYRYLPLEEIGGDIFLFSKNRNGSVSVFAGDVAGHGVSAALFITLVRFVIDRLIKKYNNKPGEFIQNFNNDVIASMGSYYLTALYGLFEKNEDKVYFRFSKGGHPPPLVYRKKENTMHVVRSSGKPVGLFENLDFEEVIVNLEKGDRVFLYTDGAIEVFNDKRIMLGYSGLMELIKRESSRPLDEMVDIIIKEIKNFSVNSEEEDDIILIGFEII